MRYAAWLAAVPESAAPPPPTNIKQRPPPKKESRDEKSRLQQIRDAQRDPDFEPEMPPVSDAALYLVEYLFEVGPATNTGMGYTAISFSELDSWSRVMGLALLPWELRFLRKLSREYASEFYVSREANRPAPWGTMHRYLSAMNFKRSMRRAAGL